MVNQALISLKTFSVDAIGTLREAFKALSNEYEVLEISSIYVVKMSEAPQGVHHLVERGNYEGLAVVLLLNCEDKPKQLLSQLKKVEKQTDRRQEKGARFKLLTFGKQIKMTPELSLPHPEFHLKPEEIILATELAPNYTHPVLNVSLSDLSKSLKSEAWGQFYAQGKSLLDKGL